MEDKEKAKDVSESNEPEAVYSKKRSLRFFSSFEEMNDADAKEIAALTPLESLMHTTALIERLYAEELKSKIRFNSKKWLVKHHWRH